jgi:hypothetical protein
MLHQKRSIFRKESLERLSSAERLDQLMQVVSPRSWLPLVALGSIVGVVSSGAFIASPSPSRVKLHQDIGFVSRFYGAIATFLPHILQIILSWLRVQNMRMS